MSYLNYQIWRRVKTDNIAANDDLVRELMASGTINTSSTLSTSIDIPAAAGGFDLVGIFKIPASNAGVYVTIRDSDETSPSGNGTHAATDAQPRILVEAGDGPVAVLMPAGGSFAAVDAAVFT